MPRHDEHVFVLERFRNQDGDRSSERILDESSLTELPRREPRDKMTETTRRVMPKVRTATIQIRTNDRVAELVKAIDSGRVKGKAFPKAIEEFSPEELGRLADELLVYYKRKFS